MSVKTEKREFTKEERYRIYVDALSIVHYRRSTNDRPFLCCIIANLLPPGSRDRYSDMPEFWSQRPEDMGLGPWFLNLPNKQFDYDSRINVLNKCIELTTP